MTTRFLYHCQTHYWLLAYSFFCLFFSDFLLIVDFSLSISLFSYSRTFDSYSIRYLLWGLSFSCANTIFLPSFGDVRQMMGIILLSEVVSLTAHFSLLSLLFISTSLMLHSLLCGFSNIYLHVLFSTNTKPRNMKGLSQIFLLM